MVFSLSCFLSSIGKLCADGGLRELLVDSGVYAGNTCWLAKNLTGMSGGSHLYLKLYKFCLSQHSYTGVGLAAIM